MAERTEGFNTVMVYKVAWSCYIAGLAFDIVGLFGLGPLPAGLLLLISVLRFNRITKVGDPGYISKASTGFAIALVTLLLHVLISLVIIAFFG